METNKEKMNLSNKIKRDEIEFSCKNMIISPPNSGKSHFIKNNLIKVYSGKKLLLVTEKTVDGTSLEKGGLNHYEIQNLRRERLLINDKSVSVMTYSEFGEKYCFNDDEVYGMSAIFCDDVHSLFESLLKTDTYSFGAAVRLLFFSLPESVTCFYFTSSFEKIEQFIRVEEKESVMDNVKMFDYSNDKEIYRNYNLDCARYSSNKDLRVLLSNPQNEILKEIKSNIKKGFIYTERINRQEEIQDILKEIGFTSISLCNGNDENSISSEQLSNYEEILNTGIIPNKYDFLIFDKKMRDVWNLKDERVDLVILDTLSVTGKIQARGRFDGDVSLLIEKKESADKKTIESIIFDRIQDLEILEVILNKKLTSIEVDDIARRLNIRRSGNNTLIKWPTIKKALEENGYKVESKKTRFLESQYRVSVVTEAKKTE